MRLESVIKRKNFDTIGTAELELLRSILAMLSDYPWNPKHVMKTSNPADIEFMAKAPEIVEFLLNYIEYLKAPREIENLRNSLKPQP